MTYILSDSIKRELALAQTLFNYSKEGLTDPLRALCGLLEEDWLSIPNEQQQKIIVTIIEASRAHLGDVYSLEERSKDPKHHTFYLIQSSINALKGDNNSHELNNYLNLVCFFLHVLIMLDTAYKSEITHVDELEHAKEIAKSAEAKAKSYGAKIVVTILDKSAQLVLLHRMHGALLISTEVAMDKARSAILMQMPSGSIKALVQPGAEFEGLPLTQPGICILDGGFPMYAESRLIGAIGISGSTAELDIKIAKYAIEENFLSMTPKGS